MTAFSLISALELSGRSTTSLSHYQSNQLLEECREKKESLNANTRKLTIDLERAHPGWVQVTVAVDAYYERCRPLIESTRVVVERLLEGQPDYPLETLYVTGGGSELPPVARVLKETFRPERVEALRLYAVGERGGAGDPRRGADGARSRPDQLTRLRRILVCGAEVGRWAEHHVST